MKSILKEYLCLIGATTIFLMDKFWCQITRMTHRGSYTSAHVLLNVLNEFGEKIRFEAMPSILLVFPKEFNNFNNT